MPKQSAGILVYKKISDQVLVLLAHPGGPFWRHKDLGSWSIPKGEFTDEEEPLDAARREFAEETGIQLEGRFIELQPVRQRSGKTVHAWAHERDLDADALVSNTFEMEWPPKSGRMQSFPEMDAFAWFLLDEAQKKINAAQADLLMQLEEQLRHEQM
ncbi:MAG: NUDIX domain-containing protein [Saprospiraceae bacterium]